ncbi:hypothetical protein DASC09_021240 [Saccharomycopsis crataegensis]|uniref:Zn(2)-C6 fungal-type domain-containing protein n=1 Tax=Saccharomycopsis crataegensis TaxID=43959 RepID=A0AAV5QK60_9ASCO|nr:hypothetical protein DASC09_021240 [Saccharomycopsis crataegensis]
MVPLLPKLDSNHKNQITNKKQPPLPSAAQIKQASPRIRLSSKLPIGSAHPPPPSPSSARMQPSTSLQSSCSSSSTITSASPPPPPASQTDVDTESLLNNFLVKNDLKILENYLSLSENNNSIHQNLSCSAGLSDMNIPPKNTSTLPSGSSNIVGNSFRQSGFESDDSLVNFKDLIKFNNTHQTKKFSPSTSPVNLLASNVSSHEELINQLQQKIKFYKSSVVADNNNYDTNNINDDDDEELNVETFVKSNDLLIYYKIFNYLIQLNDTNSNSSINNPSNPIWKLGKELEPFFDQLINFSNSTIGKVNIDNDGNNLDQFDYDLLMKNPNHLKFLEQFHNDIGSMVTNEFLLIHWVIKNYESLSFKNLNYMMFLMGGFKPVNVYADKNITAGGEYNDSLKKLKSCSRCRKNKIKCDSTLKFPYSCSNCFKKNVNYIKVHVKKLENTSVSNPVMDNNNNNNNHNNNNNITNDEDSDDNKTLVNQETTTSNNFFENVAIVGGAIKPSSQYMDRFRQPDSYSNDDLPPSSRDHIKMTRTSSNLTTSSTLTAASLLSYSPASSASSTSNDDNRKPCDCGSKHCLSGYQRNINNIRYNRRNSSLRLFLDLFNISISKNQLDNDDSYVAVDMGDDEEGNSSNSVVTCKVQLISSDLLLKKKSLKKNTLIKSLTSDIIALKARVDEMVLKEQEMLELLMSQEPIDDGTEDEAAEISDLYGSNESLKLIYDLKKEYHNKHMKEMPNKPKLATKKRSSDVVESAAPVSKKQKPSFLSTNELLVLNGFDPVLSRGGAKKSEDSIFDNHQYFKFLKDRLHRNNFSNYRVINSDESCIIEKLTVPRI